MKFNSWILLPLWALLIAVACVAPRPAQSESGERDVIGKADAERAYNLFWDAKKLDAEHGDANLVMRWTVDAIELLRPETLANRSPGAILLLYDLALLASNMDLRMPGLAEKEWARVRRRQRALLESEQREGFLAPRIYVAGSSPTGDFAQKERAEEFDLGLPEPIPAADEDGAGLAQTPASSELNPSQAVATSEPNESPADPAADLITRLEKALRDITDGFDDADVANLEEIIKLMAASYPPDDPRLVHAQVNLAKLRLARGKLAEARQLLEEVLVSLDGQGPQTEALAQPVREQLVEVQTAQHDYSSARDEARKIYESDSRNGSSTGRDPSVAGSRLRSLLYVMNDLDGLEQLAQEESSQQSPDQEPKGDRDASSQRLRDAQNALDRGDYTGAQEIFEEVIETVERSGQSNPDDVSTAHKGLAEAHEGQGNHTLAMDYIERHLRGMRSGSNTDDWEWHDSSQKYARLKEANGDSAGAGDVLQRMLDQFKNTMPAHHPLVVAAQKDVAEWKERNGDQQGALELHQATYTALASTLPSDHPNVVAARDRLISLLRELGRYEEALALLRQSASVGTTPAAYEPSLAQMAQAAAEHQLSCDLEQALSMRQQILADLEQTRPATDVAVIEAMRDVAALQRVMLHVDEARPIEGQIQLLGESAFEDGEQLILAAKSSPKDEGSNRYLPTVTVSEATMLRPGEYQVTATIEASLGLAAIEIIQDGEQARAPIRGEEWTIDSSGTKGHLSMVFQIPDDQIISVVSIAARDPNQVTSDFGTVVLQPERKAY